VNLFSLLPYAADAPFNSTQRRHDPMCLPNTRLNLLRDIHSWADGQDEPCIFWLNGLAGTGKSTIARTVARRYLDQKRLGASFFFSRGGGEVGHAGKFVTSIALQLASSVPSLDQYVYDAFRERREIASQSLSDQWQQLVLRPLSKLSGCSAQAIYVLVVDALDECDNDMDIRIIVHLLAEAQLLKTPGIRIFLTSRTEVLIRNGFVGVSDSEHREFILHSISPSIVNQDIHTFLEHSFKLIARERALAPGWPGQEIVKRLVHSADGLFIWAAITCRFIREGKRFAAKRLDIILENSSIEINAAEKHLDDIYSTVLRNCIAPGYSVDEAEELRSMLKSLLGSIVTLFSPLSAQSLSTLMSTTQDHLAQNLNDLHSILNVPEDPTLPIRLHHSSFRDFLYKQSRCGEFWVDEKRAHQVLADRCIQLMSISLEKDVCGIDAPGMLVFDAERSRIERGLPPEVRYACLYWIEHVLKSGTQLRDNDQVHIFLHKHFLHWLEALGWIGKIPEGVHAILSLETSISVCKCFT
jgi:hypothetical protein